MLEELGLLFIGSIIGAIVVGAVLIAYFIAPLKKLVVIRSTINLVAKSLDDIHSGVNKTLKNLGLISSALKTITKIIRVDRKIKRMLRK